MFLRYSYVILDWILLVLEPLNIFISNFLGICGESKQAETDFRHIIAQPGEINWIPDALPHWSFRGRAVQRRKGVSYKAD